MAPVESIQNSPNSIVLGEIGSKVGEFSLSETIWLPLYMYVCTVLLPLWFLANENLLGGPLKRVHFLILALRTLRFGMGSIVHLSLFARSIFESIFLRFCEFA